MAVIRNGENFIPLDQSGSPMRFSKHKQMKTLPKIIPSLINSYSRADSIDVIFPRGEHPDTRTIKQWKDDVFINRIKKKYGPVNRFGRRQNTILEILKSGPARISGICKKMGLSPSDILNTLIGLEERGKIYSDNSTWYIED